MTHSTPWRCAIEKRFVSGLDWSPTAEERNPIWKTRAQALRDAFLSRWPRTAPLR
jgi:hypothetical protein